jgi:chromosome segregation ATPase
VVNKSGESTQAKQGGEPKAQTPEATGASTPAGEAKFTQADIDKAKIDAGAELGRKITTLTAENTTLRTSVTTLGNQLKDVQAKIEANEAAQEQQELEGAKSSPEGVRLFQERKRLKEQEKALQEQQTTLAKQQAEIASDLEYARSSKRKDMLAAVAEAHKIPVKLIDKSFITTKEQAEELAKDLEDQLKPAGSGGNDIEHADSLMGKGNSGAITAEEAESMTMEQYASDPRVRERFKVRT